MGKILKESSLTLVLIVFFAASIAGQIISGFHSYNEDRALDHLAPVAISSYFASGHFISSVAENMESEFLQMALFVILTVHLYQRGSAESNKLPEEKAPREVQEDDYENEYSRKQLEKRPFLWRLYECSLSLALAGLFAVSFFVHAYGSTKLINEEHLKHQLPPIGFWSVFGESEFWFESFQNWQSEFFSIATIVVLSIFLRQKGSAQSKKLFDPHLKTGDS